MKVQKTQDTVAISRRRLRCTAAAATAVGEYFDVGNVVRCGWQEHWMRILGKPE